MLASAATSLLFALSAVFAARSARWLGGTLANLVRMLIALAALALKEESGSTPRVAVAAA